MVKKIAAVAGGVLIGLVIAFARAGAFPFWGSDSDASKASPPAQQQAAGKAIRLRPCRRLRCPAFMWLRRRSPRNRIHLNRAKRSEWLPRSRRWSRR